MEERYTINELSTICKVSTQSIYKLFSKNKPFINQHSTRKGRQIFYGKEVLDLLLDHYDHSQDEGKIESTSTNSPKTLPDAPQDKSEVSSTKATIEALEAKIEALEKQLAETEAEKKELLKQNGIALLLLSQEREEHLKLLSAPKPSIGERIRNLFGKKTPPQE